ncbi:hypothetical protein HF324_23700 [Chitinophaga oryzae]|uniref:Uncharacterized protein n=1 Tax=Chitinophaga oryzae TaxID=2725414 RepID=A0AAE7D8U8_9BACT|nr:hypothetical protein [Chitinophaga oryzae]QJB34156.1 hypothetical protein HF329_23850 [Chitinophaga oryzae]QJB40676.1 hypothetical protein HF324_23700 [Chitinophaga oryzae]
MSLKNYLSILLIGALIALAACKKNKKSGDPAPVTQEEALQVELAGVVAGKANVAMDSTFTFQVKVTSKVPDKGVKVTLNVVTDPGGIPLAQDDVPNATGNVVNITLKHLKEVKTYKVTVTLASLGNTANIATPLEFLITNKSGS